MDATSDLKKLATSVIENPDLINNLDNDQLIELGKYLNPAGNVISEKHSFINVSLINTRDEYIKKLLMTALVGYVYRTAKEYEPEDELAACDKKYADLLDRMKRGGAAEEEIAEVGKQQLAEHKLIVDTCRKLVTKFLDRNFQYNPDRHILSAHSVDAATDDPERNDARIKEICKQAELAPAVESKLSSKVPATYNYLRENLMAAYQEILSAQEAIKAATNTMLDPTIDIADKKSILLKKYMALNKITADMKKLVDPISAADTVEACRVEPPKDVFHHFQRYYANHFEQLRDITRVFYAEKPDLEFAVIYYDTYKTEAEAIEARNQQLNDLKFEVSTISNQGTTLLGPFKENRSRVDYYNKHTEVLKRMHEQLELDHKLGKDLMEKKVKNQKKKNIAEAGPDDKGITQYAQAINTIQEFGAKKVISKEEMEKLEAAQKVREDFEVPDNAIQVDVFYPKEDSSGEITVNKTKFYTQAEAPLHLQENSEYIEKYQPKRADDTTMKTAYTTKTIISRDGEKKILVPKEKDEAN